MLATSTTMHRKNTGHLQFADYVCAKSPTAKAHCVGGFTLFILAGIGQFCDL